MKKHEKQCFIFKNLAPFSFVVRHLPAAWDGLSPSELAAVNFLGLLSSLKIAHDSLETAVRPYWNEKRRRGSKRLPLWLRWVSHTSGTCPDFVKRLRFSAKFHVIYPTVAAEFPAAKRECDASHYTTAHILLCVCSPWLRGWAYN